MAKRNRDNTQREGPTVEETSFVSAGLIRFVTLAGVAVVIFVAIENLMETRALQKALGERLTSLETRLTQISAKVDQVGARAAAVAQAQAPRGPDPNKVYTIKTDDSPSRGPKGAPVTIAEFSDFQCPFCQKVGPTLEQIRKVYGDKVRIVWKNRPLDFHKDAMPAAMAAMAANEQGKFWEFHDKVYANQPKIQHDFLVQYAKEIGLDVKRFEESLNAARGKAKIDADIAEADSVGANGTPAFFINGHYLSGARPIEDFAKVINDELTRLKLPIPPGAPKT